MDHTTTISAAVSVESIHVDLYFPDNKKEVDATSYIPSHIKKGNVITSYIPSLTLQRTGGGVLHPPAIFVSVT